MLNFRKLEELRKNARLSQEEFGEKVGLTKNGYQGILKRKDLKVSKLVEIQRFYNVEMSYLFDEKEKLANRKHGLVEEPINEYQLREENEMLKAIIKRLDKIVSLMEKDNK